MSRKTQVLSPQEAKAKLHQRGISITQWARDHGFSRATVYDVLLSRRIGLRGQAHEVAVALGIKERP